MSADCSVILLRVWRNPQGVMIRVRTANGSQREWVVFGTVELVMLLEALIAELEDEPTTGMETED